MTGQALTNRQLVALAELEEPTPFEGLVSSIYRAEDEGRGLELSPRDVAVLATLLEVAEWELLAKHDPDGKGDGRQPWIFDRAYGEAPAGGRASEE